MMRWNGDGLTALSGVLCGEFLDRLEPRRWRHGGLVLVEKRSWVGG